MPFLKGLIQGAFASFFGLGILVVLVVQNDGFWLHHSDPLSWVVQWMIFAGCVALDGWLLFRRQVPISQRLGSGLAIAASLAAALFLYAVASTRGVG